jgi:hypothetical protein
VLDSRSRRLRDKCQSFQRIACLRLHLPFGTPIAYKDVNAGGKKMRAQDELANPAKILTHASLYLWRQWRQYPLAAWENAESILRSALNAVEQEDRIEFIRSLDRFVEPEYREYAGQV